MLNIAELELRVDEAGKVEIPAKALEQMGIHAGDTVRLAYLAEKENSLLNPSGEFLLYDGDQDIVGEILEGEKLKISGELLAEAGIPADADLEVVCGSGMIMIFSADGEEKPDRLSETEDSWEDIPRNLLAAFEGLGIPKEKIQVVLHMQDRLGKEDEDGKTGLQTD